MFRIVRKSTLDKFEVKSLANDFVLGVQQALINQLNEQLEDAQAENKRLFDHHNNKLTKPKPDKNGVLRYSNGQFAGKNGK